MNQNSLIGYERVCAEMAQALEQAGRKPDSVTLIAVSKTFGATEIEPVLAAGQRVFGENKVQEARQKWPDLLENYRDTHLHLIGPLQTNKVTEALSCFDTLHTLDRIKLVVELSKACQKLKRQPRLFVQVNTGYEPQKAGIKPEETSEFIKICQNDYGLVISGLMCIPPVNDDPAPHFSLLAKLAAQSHLPLLSMGMSHDFQIAIHYGATHIRVGSAIFGAR